MQSWIKPTSVVDLAWSLCGNTRLDRIVSESEIMLHTIAYLLFLWTWMSGVCTWRGSMHEWTNVKKCAWRWCEHFLEPYARSFAPFFTGRDSESQGLCNNLRCIALPLLLPFTCLGWKLKGWWWRPCRSQECHSSCLCRPTPLELFTPLLLFPHFRSL